MPWQNSIAELLDIIVNTSDLYPGVKTNYIYKYMFKIIYQYGKLFV